MTVRIFKTSIFTLLLSGCITAEMNINKQCEQEQDLNTCKIIVEKIQGNGLWLYFETSQTKNQGVEISAKVKKGTVTIWVVDSFKTKTQLTIRPKDKIPTLINGLAKVVPSYPDKDPIFKIYINPHGIIFNEAQNIEINVKYRN